MYRICTLVYRICTSNKQQKPQALDPIPPFLQGRQAGETDLHIKFSIFISICFTIDDMVITRQEAIEQNLNKYYTGNPCVNGHYAERYVKCSTCVECKRIQKKAQRKRQKTKRISEFGKDGKKRYFTGEPCSKGHIAERFVSNGHCVECKKEQGAVYRRKNGVQSIEERKLKTERKKELKRERYQASLLSPNERDIAEYARTCLSRLNGRDSARIPTEIAEMECGYTSQQLHQHLSSQKKGWGLRKNRGRWHIDHIIPIQKLIKAGVTEVAIINSLDNLKLITAKNNLKKSSKLLISKKKFEEYIMSKRVSCFEMLGMYSPRKRRRRLVEELIDKIYRNLEDNVLQHSDFFRYDKEIVTQAIKDDLYDGYSYRYSKGVTYSKFMKNFTECRNGKLDSLLLEGYKPLVRLKNSNLKLFKYRDDCEEYFQEMANNEKNPICSQYLKSQVYEKCRFCSKKGFLKRLFS